jgi:hypothetical protein
MRWILLSLLLCACQGVDYQRLDDAQGESEGPWSRRVGYAIAPEFFRDPPDCVMVLRAEGDVPTDPGAVIEDALARSLSAKVTRVVAPAERDRLARDLGVDPAEEGGRALLARQARCRFLALPKVTSARRVFALIWAELSLGLTVEVLRAADGQMLWAARHEVRRGDGGLPVSLLSFGGAAARAGMAVSDEEAMISMVDDALRRMAVALPDVR